MPSVGTLAVTLAGDPGAYKRVYTELKAAVVWTTPEFDWYGDLEDSDIMLAGLDASGADNMYMPIDVVQGFGAAAIPDGGREALPGSPTLQYGTLKLVAWNARISITRQAKAFNTTSQAAMVTNELALKRKKRLEALRHKAAINFYGTSIGVCCMVSATVSGTTAAGAITFTSVYGDTGLTHTGLIGNLFNVNDQIALLVDGTTTATIIPNGTGIITAKGAANVYSVAWTGAVSILTTYAVTFANNAAYGDTYTAAGHTDQNKWVPGLKDMVESTSLHGVSGTTYPGWSAAGNDSTGGRFTPVKLLKMRHTMLNFGKPLKRLILAQGVIRDMADQNNALLRFDSIAAIQFDGSGKTKEEQSTSRYVPNGHVFGIADMVLKKKVLGDLPNAGSGEMDKLENYARYVEGEDFMWLTAAESRKGLYEFRGLTES